MKTWKIILIILGTIILILAIAGHLENAYYIYKQDNAPMSFTEYYLGGHCSDTDADKDPSSDLYRGF